MVAQQETKPETLAQPDGGINTIVATDCGSTTTKAILIVRREGEFRLVARGEAPTTVEAPFDDVTVGVLNAVGELEELTGRQFLAGGRIRTPSEDGSGADLFLSTSSAGGGLQMLVCGLVKSMTAESAQRAALGAGAIVVDVLALDDGRVEHEKIERIRSIRPDMILFSGGTDGGAVSHLVDMAEMLRAADPKPRLGRGFLLPVIFAGNKDAREPVTSILDQVVKFSAVDNIRPVLERENLGPAREAIHRVFLEHVMAQAPGYDRLLSWTSAPVMSTPAAVGEMVQAAARIEGANVLAVDIGGATTDVFTVFDGAFHRTVSANLGLSYSISNVLAEAGAANIMRWLPFAIDESGLRDQLRNKMIRPTTIPQTMNDLLLEQAVAREALRLAFEHHKQLAVGLKGVRQERTVSEVFAQTEAGQAIVDMWALGLIIGSGGILSHAPRRHQAAMMMIDAFQPLGVTELAVDSIFMMPQLGVLAQVQPQAAQSVFRRDCLVPLGTVVAPEGTLKPGEKALSASIERDGTVIWSGDIPFGSIALVPLETGASAELRAQPARRLDLGQGRGRAIEATVAGGVVGVIFDCRGRPLALPDSAPDRSNALAAWMSAIGAR
jgi:uncharacterized protein (TIGR01319 family)